MLCSRSRGNNESQSFRRWNAFTAIQSKVWASRTAIHHWRQYGAIRFASGRDRITLKPPRRPFRKRQLAAHSRDLIVENCYESARGYVFFAQKDYASAQDELSADPHSPIAINWLVAAREKLGDQTGAESARLRLVSAAPTVGGVGDSSQHRICPLKFTPDSSRAAPVLPRQPARFEQTDCLGPKLFSNRRVIHTRMTAPTKATIIPPINPPPAEYQYPEQPSAQNAARIRERYRSGCRSRRLSLPCQRGHPAISPTTINRSIRAFQPP